LVDGKESLFKTLRYVITGGDVISMRHVERARRASPSLVVINAYGPTENTTYSTCYPIKQAEPRTIPIGRPIPNSKAYIFDREMKVSPLGAIGELYVGGDGLARGYLNRPSLTQELFIMNPLAPGERIYRTGDLVRRRADGAIEFIGRVDRQVKIRGFRIELGEIENRLLEHAAVKEAAVTSATDTNGSKYLCAYYVVEPKISAAELREHLATLLPSYMVPSYFCELEAMPLTESGKIDQRALPPPQLNAEPASVHVPLSNDTEMKVAHIWEELLETTNIGALDNFFEIGGHSLKASELASRLSAEFGIPVSLRMVFDSPTVSELACLVSNGDGKEYRNAVAR
jgi:tyrocidine synthetase-3